MSYEYQRKKAVLASENRHKINNKIQYGKTFIQIPTSQLRMCRFQGQLPLI